MMARFFILIICNFLIAGASYGQLADRDALWERLVYINDTLRSASETELNILLKLESSKNPSLVRNDSTWAFLLAGIGHLYYEQGDYLKGALYYHRAIDLIHSGIDKPWIKPDHLTMFYYRLSAVYDSLNQVSDKMKALDSCIAISRSQKSTNIFYLAALYQKIGYYYDIGDYNNCINYANICEMMGREYAHKGKREYDVGMAYVSSSLTWNVISSGQLNHYFVSDSLLKLKLEEFNKTGNTFDLGSLYEQLAHVQMSKGNRDQALNYYKKALAIEKKAGLDIGCKGILNNIGFYIYFQHDKDYDGALYYYNKALALKNRDPGQSEFNSMETMNIIGNIGSLYAKKEQFDSAFFYFQLALDQISPGITESDLLANQYNRFARLKKINYLTNLLIDKGDALIMQYKSNGKMKTVKEAVRIYKLTDQILDRIKMEQTDLESKLLWSG